MRKLVNSQMSSAESENPYLGRVLENFKNKSDEVFCRFIRGDQAENLHWSDIRSSACKFLTAYQRAGIVRHSVVLIFLKHVPDLYGSFVGAMLGGYVPSFMPCPSRKQDPNLYWQSHSLLFKRIKPAAIVADGPTIEEMVRNGLDLSEVAQIRIEEIPAIAEASLDRVNFPKAHECALLQHSSGTTGLKKGVALSYSAIDAQVAAYSNAIDLRSTDVVASWLPLYHDMGLIACMIMPIATGVQLIHIDAFEWAARPRKLLDMSTRYRATLCWLPNFAFEHLVSLCKSNRSEFDLHSVRAFINCSEVCRAETFDRFVQAFAICGVRQSAMQCCYAMAETVFAVTQTKLDHPPKRLWVKRTDLDIGEAVVFVDAHAGGRELVEVGSAIAGAVPQVYDSSRRVLPDGVVGEIAVHAQFLFDGYYAQQELTQDRLDGDYYWTRDMGFLSGGSLFVLGRLDDLVIVNGRNVYAHEVEFLLSEVDGIKKGRVVAVRIEDERNGTQALAIIVERHDLVREISDLRKEITRRVSSALQVTVKLVYFVEAGWLVKTTSGKISRELNAKKLLTELSLHLLSESD
jgi:fatty-acyl-CoA synthase